MSPKLTKWAEVPWRCEPRSRSWAAGQRIVREVNKNGDLKAPSQGVTVTADGGERRARRQGR